MHIPTMKKNLPPNGKEGLSLSSWDRMVSLRSTVFAPSGRYGSNLQLRLDASLQKQNSPLGGRFAFVAGTGFEPVTFGL